MMVTKLGVWYRSTETPELSGGSYEHVFTDGRFWVGVSVVQLIVRFQSAGDKSTIPD